MRLGIHVPAIRVIPDWPDTRAPDWRPAADRLPRVSETPPEYLMELEKIISSGVVSRATALAHVPALVNALHTNP